MSEDFITPERHSEAAFETIITDHLFSHGYSAIDSSYDKKRALFPEETLAFIKATQPKEWAKIESLNGENTGKMILRDLCKWLDDYGSLQTLRHGFKCFGRTLHLAFFKAAHSLNKELEAQYQANHLGVIRQLHYSAHNNNSLDITLVLNGLPIITIEIKNPLTGQTVEGARQQYMSDRDPRELLFEFKRRTLLHLAVDTEEVWMSTHLAGASTQFLPFNKGNLGGSGNPVDSQSRTYRTAYLWEEILQRDSILDILANFLHLQVEEKRDEQKRKFKKETLIFPRYHQLQAVRTIIEAARQEGPGHNYLIEHSAGSGKSNTIGWLAYRLASLHNQNNERIFSSVIIITDRLILDHQLQDTIYQFEHKQGVVQKIDENSLQLTQALQSFTPIIISTLQKFPYVSRHLQRMAEEAQNPDLAALATHPIAVIVDEAHSSQSGNAAAELKGVLGGQDLVNTARLQAEEDGSEFVELYKSMAQRGQQQNISFFAFTATPKHKTLTIFGRDGEPFHRYTMRQAIEEGFIMDVLRHYTTYALYYKLIKKSQDDPNVERKKAAQTLARFMRLHPYNIAQKTEIMVEHFYAFTRHKIDGHAKAMVVTGSRLEAVRYKESFDRYIKNKGYPIKTLVAFSGIVQDDKIADKTYTEEAMNQGIKEHELPERFGTHEYQVLLVAEKYQTGFDQPLLHTMYVDKRLAGIQAVQTLSRLNRIHPHKEETFVLDFANDRNEIQEAFKQFYEGAEIGEEADPASLYHIKTELDQAGIYQEQDIEQFCAIYFKPKARQSLQDHQAMNAVLDPVVERFKNLYQERPEEAELWRSKLQSFHNLYSFLSQIIPYQDSDLEKLYVFLRHLSAKLPRHSSGILYSFDDDVTLQYYRLQKISEGSIDLNGGNGYKLNGPKEVGTGDLHESAVPLSQIIDIINERFGTDFNQADQLFFDQLIEDALHSEELKQSIKVNSKDNFTLQFAQLLQTLFIERIDQNETIFARYMNDETFQKLLSGLLGEQVYRQLVNPHLE